MNSLLQRINCLADVAKHVATTLKAFEEQRAKVCWRDGRGQQWAVSPYWRGCCCGQVADYQQFMCFKFRTRTVEAEVWPRHAVNLSPALKSQDSLPTFVLDCAQIARANEEISEWYMGGAPFASSGMREHFA